jgi:hypothetical protein
MQMSISNDYPARIPEEVKIGQQGNLRSKSTYYKIVITGCGNTLQEVLQTGDSPHSPQPVAADKPNGFDSNG